jgi:uncharacterized protein (TIGR03067 family)
MRPKALLIVIAGFLVAADAKEDKELKNLQGTWKVVSGETGGVKVPADKLKDAVLVIDGDKFIMTDRGKEKEGKTLTFKIDLSKRPKQLDLTDPKEKDAKPVPCIYALDGDELKLCIPLVPLGKKEDVQRPASFDTKDKLLMLMVCQREKK